MNYIFEGNELEENDIKINVSWPKWWDDYAKDIIHAARQLKKCDVDEDVIQKFLNNSFELIAREAVEFTIRQNK